MTTFDWSNNYSKIGKNNRNLNIQPKLSESVIVPENDDTFLLFQIQRKDGRPHLEFPRSFHEREEDLAGIAERKLRKRDMSVSKISDSATLANKRSEMYHD